MTEIHVIGAGMAGLLAANMLRRHRVTVLEKQKTLPNNHHAVLRFRTHEIGNLLGIPFKKVNMLKTYMPYNNIVADSLSYSEKCTGVYLSDRSIIAGTTHAERYIAPVNLIEQMADNVLISYMTEWEPRVKAQIPIPIISTMPMPHLMKILNYISIPKFESKPGLVFTGRILNCDAYVSILFPNPDLPYSRATITGDRLMVEFPDMLDVPEAIDLANIYHYLGLYDAVVLDTEFKKQQYFKITEVSDSVRKSFMRWASVHHNIYSLGRYATWRPKLLLDDLVHDIRKIEEWICK
jgi:NAD(P)-binding Rossmann-like domain